MARKTYTEGQKANALAKVEEIGLTRTSRELSRSAEEAYSRKCGSQGRGCQP